MDKAKIKQREQEIIDLARTFCDEMVNVEYAELAERMIRKLGRKRSVPFATGRTKIWAAAVIHALGTINFLFDPSFEPAVTPDDLNSYFGTNKSTTAAKSKQIRDLLKLHYFDSEFSTGQMHENSPAMQFVSVDGYLYPVASLPEQHQKMVHQARAEGNDISFTTK